MYCQGNLGEAVGLGLRISSRMSCELHFAGLFHAGGVINWVDLSSMAQLLWNTVPEDVRLFHWASSFRTALRPCLSQHSTDWGEKTLTLHASFPKTAGTDFSYRRWLVLCCRVSARGLGKHQLTPLFVDSAQALWACFCFKLCRVLKKGLHLGLMNVKLKLLFKAAVCSATWTW